MTDLRRRIAQAVDPWFPNPEFRVPLVLDAIMNAILSESQTSSKPLPLSAPCPKCSKPLAADEVYNAGYEPDNYRIIPATYGRGQYCDHKKRLEGQGPEMTQDQIEAMERGGK